MSNERGGPLNGAARRTRRLSLRAEDGQSAYIVVGAMFVILLLAAFAIDVSGWYQKHHNAQVAADASALAAANYMGHGGTASTGTNTATSYASSNGLSISSSNVTIDTSKKTVTVTVPTVGSLSFAGIALGSGPNISARAVATWARKDCSSAGNRCGFIFAADPVCSGDTNVQGIMGNGQPSTIPHGVTIQKNGQGNAAGVSGGIISNANITTQVNAGQTFPNAQATWSNASGCSGPSPSSPSPYAAAYTAAPFVGWPLDYTQVYTSCPGTSTTFGSVSCTGGFPSYCTNTYSGSTATVELTAPVTNAVYCNAGTGTTTDPSTWNGTFKVDPPGQSTTYDATYIAGTVNFNPIPTNSTFGPAANNTLLAYAAACNNSTPAPTTCNSSPKTTAPAVDLTSTGNATISGDIFAPGGVIDSHLGGNPTITTFLEGWDVVYNADGTALGGGPSIDNVNEFLYDFLIQ